MLESFKKIEHCFKRNDYHLSHIINKVARFANSANGRTVYLDRQVKGIDILIHPAYAEEAEEIANNLTELKLRYTKNSNLTAFPSSSNGQKYGFKIPFERLADLEKFLTEFGKVKYTDV